MSAVGLEAPLESGNSPLPKSKRSFLQRLNKRHGSLNLHMRSKRGGKIARQQQQHQQQPEKNGITHSRTTSASQNEVSETPSLISSSTSDRRFSEKGSRYYDIDDDISPTTPQFSPEIQGESEFEVPIRYVVARNDKEEGGQSFVQGLRGFMHRKQTSNPSKPECPSDDPPFPPRKHSSNSASSKMSDEQMEKWLQPEDADLHRERKSSENLNLKAQLAENNEEVVADIEKAKDAEENNPKLKSSSSTSNPYPDGWNPDSEEGKQEERTAEIDAHGNATFAEKGAQQVAVHQEDSQGLLSLPDELLQGIAIHLDTNSAWFFRLCCKRLYDNIPAPPSPDGMGEDLKTFFSHIKSFFPDNLTYCAECKKYHPWTAEDYYLVEELRNKVQQRCRRHFNSRPESEDEILGAGNFICPSCNTMRSGKKCKTCAKCESCARLRRSWMLMTWVEEECDYCAASHSPKWKHYKGEFEGRVNPGEHREWMGV